MSALAFIVGCNIRYSFGLLSIVNLHKNAFKRLFQGRSSFTIKQWVQEFLAENYEKLLYLPAIQKLKSAQESGHLTVILSSSPNFLVEAVAKELGVSCWYATEYAVDKDQKFCQIASLMLGEGKAAILNGLAKDYCISKNATYAYSDSHIDLPFLMAAGTAYGVNPNRKLRQICRANHWPIL